MIALILVLHAGYAYPSVAQEDSYRSAARFFRDSHPGDLGIVFKSLGKIVRVHSGTVLNIPDTTEIEFLVNNRRKNKLTHYPTGYLAISALRIFDQTTPTTPSVELFRNENWYRGKEALGELDNLPVRPPDINRFVSIHQATKPLDFASVDKALGGKWHAQISADGYASIQDAWFWTYPYMMRTLPELIPTFSPLKSDSDHIQLRGLLVRFEEAPIGSNGPKLRFEIKSHSCRGMLVRTYSPISAEYETNALIRLGR